jgi:hypothetical protein
MRGGSRLGRIVLGVAAVRAASPGAKGSGAPAAGRASLVAAVICLATLALTVAPAAAEPPQVANIDYGASYTRVKAKLYTWGLPTTWEFQFISDSDYEDNIANSRPPFEGATAGGSGLTGVADAVVRGHFTGLAPSTTYHVRLTMENADGPGEYTGLPTFTTRDGTELPSATTGGFEHVNFEHAYLRGSVNPNTDRTAYWFEYGVADCGSSACSSMPAHHEGAAGEGSEPIDVIRPVGGLQPDTTYHYRLVAENTSGTVAGLDQTFTTAPEPELQTCPNEAAREEVHARALPDCRTWELVSPPEKFGGSIIPGNGRIRAAAEEAPSLPMAASFSSFTGFTDVHGIAIATDYVSQRTLEPGTNGWSTHGVAPPQESLSFASALEFQPFYWSMSEDLTRGVFGALTPVPTADDPHENVSGVMNLYGRDDLRSPGAGTYRLLTDSVNPLGNYPFNLFGPRAPERPIPGGNSADFEESVFQSKFPLTADAGASNEPFSKQNYKAFKFVDGQVRLVTAGSPTCPGGVNPIFPCSALGRGLKTGNGASYSSIRRELSTDGSRLEFSSPVGNSYVSLSRPSNSPTPGITTKLFQLDDEGTEDRDDDTVIQLNTSEKSSPDIARPAVYLTANADGDRVFFASPEQLTNEPVGETMGAQGIGLYLWDRKDSDETQQVVVDAAGGSFTLTARSQPTVGVGNLTESSTTVEEVKGSFAVGQTVEGASIAPGTTVTALGTFSNSGNSTLTLSQPAEATASEVPLKGAMQATTAPLPDNATAAAVQSALEALHFSAAFPELPLLGKGNVEVTGGPGGPGAATPYSVTFTGALEGVNVVQMSADGSGLTGGGATASVSTTTPVQNLTLLGPLGTTGPVTENFTYYGMLGAGADGHRAYFVTTDAGRTGIFYWQDVSGPPGGSLSFVSPLSANELDGQQLSESRASSQRVSPDGKRLLFGTALMDPIGYEAGTCGGEQPCAQAYLYSADGSTPTEPNLVCVSCDLPSPGIPSNLASFDMRGDYQTVAREAGLQAVSAPTPYISETRNLDVNGRYVFFNSQRALVQGDTNGVIDAYEYDTQTESVQLLSSGTSSANSYFNDASEDGSDAFIVTRERLSDWDVDAAYDVYDVRVEGGIPEPPVQIAECEGDSCKGSAPPPPPPPFAGSATFAGPGNPKQKRCPRGKRAVRRDGKTRCVKKHRKHRRRDANTNGRAGR